MSMELDAQGIVYQKLTANAMLMARVTGVFDDVPQGQPMPYIALGEDVATEDDDSCTIGASLAMTIHTFSAAKGKKETKEIQGLIKDSLHYAEATTADNYTVGIMQEQSTSFLDSDGETRHGVNRVRILIRAL